MRKDLPSNIFQKDIWILVFSILGLAIYAGLILLGVNLRSIWALFILSIIIGVVSEVLSMLSHEILHGNMTESKSLALLVSLPISFINLISPHYWMYWHNYHHRCVDFWTPRHRPFELGFESDGYPKLRGKMKYFELFFYKTFHILRVQSQFLSLKKFNIARFKKLKRQTALDCAFILFYNLALAYFMGPRHWLLLVVAALAVQNFFASLFLVTQHSKKLDPLDSINYRVFSVTICPIIDKLFVNSGKHFEHHLFPNLSFRKLSIVSNAIELKYPQLTFNSNAIVALKTIYEE